MDPESIRTLLKDIFSNKTADDINNIMEIVYSGEPGSTPEEQFESMVNLLSESGDSTLTTSEPSGASGVSRGFTDTHFDYLQNIFPRICPKYLHSVCSSQGNNFSFDQAIEDISNVDYPTTEKDPLDVWDHLKEMLPDADPIYLRNQARVLVERPDHELNAFIQNAIEKNDYPTIQEYFSKQKKEAEVNKFKNGFSVEAFLQKVPDPFKHFQKTNRKHALTENESNETDVNFALNFLYNHYTYLRQRDISKVLHDNNNDIVKTFERLKRQPKAFVKPRPFVDLNEETENVHLLEEIAFLKHQNQIRYCIKMKKESYRRAAAEADAYDLWQTCKCCFDDRLLPEDCYFCNRNCVFCKECVKSGVEMVIGKGELKFSCLADCGSFFTLQTIQMVLDQKMFERLFQKIQMEEIKQANIEGLETCPFCDFSMIPIDGDTIFKCGNFECMKETCRLCRHESHIPLRCNEIEYDEDVRMRTYIENKMTDALVRECHNCKKKLLKESGCNKMTCTCGARMCYVCGVPVNGYGHFNTGSCPLYTENLQQFHLTRVLQGAKQAKQELGIQSDPDKLKFDPTKNLTGLS